MEKDILPELLEEIKTEFNRRLSSSEVNRLSKELLLLNKASFESANDYAIEVGETLAKVFNEKLTAEVLPDGRMYYNIAERLMNSTLKENHELVSNYSTEVQTLLNNQAGLKIKGLSPELNQDRIDGIVERLSKETDFEQIKWILDEPIVNYSQSIVDDMVRTNAEFQAKTGLGPKIIRKPDGKPCDWCKGLVGEYDYNEVSDPGNDVFRRHDYCRCAVIFEPRKGKLTTVHSGTQGERRYVKDQYGGYELSKKARIERAEERAKTEKARRNAARKKRMDTWARKNSSK